MVSMISHSNPIDAQQTLASLATRYHGAARVFQRHGLDFCCRGQVTLEQACRDRRLDVGALVAELGHVLRTAADDERWDERPVPELIDHLLRHYHDAHRQVLPHLQAMAAKVERVHAAHEDCPRGLAALLQEITDELESHMQKEEQVLFPMLRGGHGRYATAPIQVMESEHVEFGEDLARLRALAHDYVPPAGACTTWRALCLGLEEFERDAMRHIHLENHVLFPRCRVR